MADNIQVELNEQLVDKTSRALAALLVSEPETRKRIQKLIRAEMKEAAKLLRKDAKEVMKNDPRKSYLAVRSTIYRKILGGNLNILASRRAGQRAVLLTQKALRAGQRGGNRRPMSKRTDNLNTYYGKDRGFILRFLNDGTYKSNPRTIEFTADGKREKVKRGSQGGDLSKYGKTINTGSRGNIAPRNWFSNAAPQALVQMSERLEEILDEELAAAFNEAK
jgi:hypothetical protein